MDDNPFNFNQTDIRNKIKSKSLINNDNNNNSIDNLFNFKQDNISQPINNTHYVST